MGGSLLTRAGSGPAPSRLTAETLGRPSRRNTLRRALEDIASPGIVYDDVPNGERFEGLDGVRRYVGHVHSWASQVEITVLAVHSGTDGAVAEWVMRGVQDRPIPGRVPVVTNRPFELKGVTLVELRDGRIVRAADYIDVLRFVVQLGSRIELPGGVVVPPDSDAAREGDAPGSAARRSAEPKLRQMADQEHST